MGKAKPVIIAGRMFSTQGEAQDYFKSQKKELLPEGPIKEGLLFDALKDVYERYCHNSPGYELNGRLIIAFSVDFEKRTIGNNWVTHPCYKVHFSNNEIRPFSIDKAVQSVTNSTK